MSLKSAKVLDEPPPRIPQNGGLSRLGSPKVGGWGAVRLVISVTLINVDQWDSSNRLRKKKEAELPPHSINCFVICWTSCCRLTFLLDK